MYYYYQTAYGILTNELALILSTFPKQERQKRGIIMSLEMGFIGLAYEGTSSFLHYKRQKAFYIAVQAMENKVNYTATESFIGKIQ